MKTTRMSHRVGIVRISNRVNSYTFYTLYLVPVILLFLMRFYSQFFVVHLHIVVACCLEHDNAIFGLYGACTS